MIHSELPLGSVASFDLYIPFAGLGILTDRGNGGRGPDVEFECVRVKFEPICELQSRCIDRPCLRESKRGVSQGNRLRRMEITDGR